MKNFLFYLLPLYAALASCSGKIIYTVEKKPTAAIPQKEVAKQDSTIIHRDGRCFKTCMTSDYYETQTVRVPVYTGSDPDAPLRMEKFLIEPAKTQINALANGGKTKSIMPAVVQEVTVLADTFFYRDFRYETITCKVLAKQGGQPCETEVVCSDERTPGLYLRISDALKTSGYLDFVSEKWSQALGEALQRFQQDHGLAVGDLSVETLQFLGIDA